MSCRWIFKWSPESPPHMLSMEDLGCVSSSPTSLWAVGIVVAGGQRRRRRRRRAVHVGAPNNASERTPTNASEDGVSVRFGPCPHKPTTVRWFGPPDALSASCARISAPLTARQNSPHWPNRAQILATQNTPTSPPCATDVSVR